MKEATPTHPLLARLLRRAGAHVDPPPPPEVWRAFLAQIDRTCHDVEQEWARLQRALANAREAKARQAVAEQRRACVVRLRRLVDDLDGDVGGRLRSELAALEQLL